MARNDSSVKLEQTLSILSQNFFRELSKIVEQRLKLERQSVSALRTSDMASAIHTGDCEVKKAQSAMTPVAKNFTVRLESSLGEKLAKSRGTADELEDRLQETRMSFEDKLRTVERMRRELDRREELLVKSIRQIEAYLRALFYLKTEADAMYAQLKVSSQQQDDVLKQLRNDCCTNRKESILEAISAFLSAKEFLEKTVSDLPRYSTLEDLVEYFLVLESLRDDLLSQEAECARAQEELTTDRQRLEEYRRRLPTAIVSKENEILELKSRLKNLKDDIAQLEEQIDGCVTSRLREESAWYDVQRWIKKLHATSVEIRPPPEQDSDPLEGLKDFVKDAFQMVDRLH